MNKKMVKCIVTAVLTGFFSVSSASAATYVWGTIDGVWSNAAGWTTGGIIPGSSDLATIRGGKTVTVDYIAPVNSAVFIGENFTTGTGTVNVIAGKLETSRLEIGRRSIGGAGWLNISGGTVLFTGAAGTEVSIGGEVAGKHTEGHLNISGGTLTGSLGIGSAIAGDSNDTMTVIGNAATITGVNLNLYASGTLDFIFGAAGISTMAYSGTFSNYTGSTIIIDGSAYTGGANTFDLITAGTLTAQNSTVILTNFANTATLNWGTEPGIVSVSIIPEPATIGMLGLGTLAIILFRRRMAK